ncbi:hypothetical protein Bbelb_131470 [Branchiostoma belcheri]|nr:hypothetical protein Bbelb_131470 [Branchiostoma belcheri]
MSCRKRGVTRLFLAFTCEIRGATSSHSKRSPGRSVSSVCCHAGKWTAEKYEERREDRGELHRLWRDHVGIRPRYAGRGASASREFLPRREGFALQQSLSVAKTPSAANRPSRPHITRVAHRKNNADAQQDCEGGYLYAVCSPVQQARAG